MKQKRGLRGSHLWRKSPQCISYSVWTHTYMHTQTLTHTRAKMSHYQEKKGKISEWMVLSAVCYSETFWLGIFAPPHLRTDCLSSQIKLLCVCVCVRAVSCVCACLDVQQWLSCVCVCVLRFKRIRKSSSTNEILHQQPVGGLSWEKLCLQLFTVITKTPGRTMTVCSRTNIHR